MSCLQQPSSYLALASPSRSLAGSQAHCPGHWGSGSDLPAQFRPLTSSLASRSRPVSYHWPPVCIVYKEEPKHRRVSSACMLQSSWKDPLTSTSTKMLPLSCQFVTTPDHHAALTEYSDPTLALPDSRQANESSTHTSVKETARVHGHQVPHKFQAVRGTVWISQGMSQ